MLIDLPEADPKIIGKGLACIKDTDVIKEYIRNLTIVKNTLGWSEKKATQMRILYHVVKKHARKDKVLDFILQNFNMIYPR